MGSQLNTVVWWGGVPVFASLGRGQTGLFLAPDTGNWSGK